MSSHAAVPSLPVFEVGDRMPDFVLPDVSGAPVGYYFSAIGKPLVLIICANSNREVLRPFAERAEALAMATVIFVTPFPPLENAALAQELRLPFALLSDVSGEVVTALLNDGRGANTNRH